MAGLLKNAVVGLVLITATKLFIAAHEELRYAATDALTSVVQEASQEPEETTRRDGKSADLYPAELCNPFYQFWGNHTSLWTLQTSDSTELNCKRQTLKQLNATGVLLTKLSRSGEETISRDYYWTLGQDDAIYYYRNESFNVGSIQIRYELKLKAVMEYQGSTNNCAVIRYEEWYYRTEASRDEYDKSCAKDNSTWCQCTSIADGTNTYFCLNNPVYELVMYDDPTANAPQDCKDQYDSKRKLYRSTDKKIYEKDCGKN